jgi:hypothetical protein
MFIEPCGKKKAGLRRSAMLAFRPYGAWILLVLVTINIAPLRDCHKVETWHFNNPYERRIGGVEKRKGEITRPYIVSISLALTSRR